MYNYLVQSGDVSGKHFSKYNYPREVERCVQSNSNSFANVSNMSSAQNKYETGQAYYSSNSHVYRIKDLMDAINTSVIMDGKKKEEYIQMLSNNNTDINTDDEFVTICRNLGECDIM